MSLSKLKNELTQIADFFYQEQNEEGMDAFLKIAARIGQNPELSGFVNPLFDALEQGDYILAADILQHEMAEQI